MTLRSILADGALIAGTAALVLITAMAVPGVVSAQPYDQSYQDQAAQAQAACQQQQNNRAVGGAIIGGIAGAVLGSNLSRGNGRTGGAVIGGVAGAAVGADVGTFDHVDCAQFDSPPPGYGRVGYDYDTGAPPPPALRRPVPGDQATLRLGPGVKITFPDRQPCRRKDLRCSACQDQSGRAGTSGPAAANSGDEPGRGRHPCSTSRFALVWLWVPQFRR